MSYKLFTVVNSISMFTSQLVNPFLVIFFMGLPGGSFVTAGIALAIMKFSSVMFSVPFNWIGDKLARKPLMILGGFGCAFVFYQFSMVGHIEEVYFLAILFGVFGAMCSVAGAFLAEMTKGESRGALVGVFHAIMGLAVGAAIYIGANAIDTFGFTQMFYVVAGAEVFYAIMMLFVKLEKE